MLTITGPNVLCIINELTTSLRRLHTARGHTKCMLSSASWTTCAPRYYAAQQAQYDSPDEGGSELDEVVK